MGAVHRSDDASDPDKQIGDVSLKRAKQEMMVEMTKPDKLVIDPESTYDHGIFVLEPLEQGYGVTLGNAMRRVLLSSIPGTAIIGVRISGVQHEFQTIPGVAEDVVEIVLNLKGVRLRLIDPEIQKVAFKLWGPHEFIAQDIEKVTPLVRVTNPNHHIATLAEDANFEIELYFGTGRGYVPAEEQQIEGPDIIAIDAIFSPITRVSYRVEPTRVGRKTDYERLVLEVFTDGTVSAQDAVDHAAQLLREHFQYFLVAEPQKKGGKDDGGGDIEKEKIRRILLTPISEIELSTRAENALKAARIYYLADLVRRDPAELLEMKNFGKKTLEELQMVLEQFGLKFGMDVSQCLTPDDLRMIQEKSAAFNQAAVEK